MDNIEAMTKAKDIADSWRGMIWGIYNDYIWITTGKRVPIDYELEDYYIREDCVEVWVLQDSDGCQCGGELDRHSINIPLEFFRGYEQDLSIEDISQAEINAGNIEGDK